MQASPGAAQILTEVRTKLAHVVFGGVDKARLAAAQVGEPQDVQPGRIDDAPVVSEAAPAVEYGDL